MTTKSDELLAVLGRIKHGYAYRCMNTHGDGVRVVSLQELTDLRIAARELLRIKSRKKSRVPSTSVKKSFGCGLMD